MNEKIVFIVTFAAYLGLMLGIGLYFYSKTESLSEYVLGDRKLGIWGTAISAQASDMSGWLLLGLPGAAFTTGVSGSLWMALGLAMGTYLNWKFIAKRLRISTENLSDSITIPSYLENRFNDTSKILRIASALFILLFFLVYTSSGFVAGGKLFQTVFDVPYFYAVLIGALVVIIYTFLGGFMAVCWTDVVQGMLMFGVIVVLPIVVIFKNGGLSNTMASVDPVLLKPVHIPFLTGIEGAGKGLGIISIISSLAWGLGYFGQPHILARFMAIKDPKEIDAARIIAMIWVVLSLGGALAVGLVAHSVFPALDIADSERIFMLLIAETVPLVLSGVFLCAILASVMSTADSQLLVTASTISEDFYKGLIKPNASDKELVLISRITIIVVAVIAFLIALNPDSSVLDLVSYAWAGFGSAFGPVILVSLFWKNMTRNGAAAGMISGGITSAVWPLLRTNFPHAELFQFYEIVPGFLVALLFIFLFSLSGNKTLSREV